MLKPRAIFSSYPPFGRLSRYRSLMKHDQNISPTTFLPFKNALILSRFTGYTHEKALLPRDDEELLKINISRKGKCYQRLLDGHNTHTKIVEELSCSFSSHGVNVKLVEGEIRELADVDWADLIISVGGDGTFLTAASKILNSNKYIVGINSHPSSSEGSLCLPRIWYENISGVVDRLMSGKFRTIKRQRIRILSTPFLPYNSSDEPKLVSLGKILPICKPSEVDSSHEILNESNPEYNHFPLAKQTMLPVRALNEVFVGACMSARVSQYEISIDSSELLRQKSSGINICTGTGSSSWHYDINRVSNSLVSSIISISDRVRGQNSSSYMKDVDHSSSFPSACSDKTYAKNHNIISSDEIADIVAREYNEKLRFSPYADYMAYSIRDLVSNSIFRFNRSHGFAHRIKLVSRMHDGYLSVDGVATMPFNDGSSAEFNIDPEDSLTCIDIAFENV